jgi:hypothetical protein
MRDGAEDESWCAVTAEVLRLVERNVSSWRGMTRSEIEDYAWKHGGFACRPTSDEAFAFTLRAYQLGLENALSMQARNVAELARAQAA